MRSMSSSEAGPLRIVFCGQAPSWVTSFCSLAKCLGVPSVPAEMTDPAHFRTFLEDTIAASTAVVLDVDSLIETLPRKDLPDLADLLRGAELPVLLLVAGRSEGERGGLRVLSGGAVDGWTALATANRVEFPADADDLAAELRSFSYQINSCERLGLTVGEPGHCSEVMRVDGVPTCLRIRNGAAEMFVWGTPAVFDPERLVAGELEFEQAVDEYVPAVIFLRYAFGERCWHVQGRSAGLVIDDPLLSRRYGCIDFPELLRSARSHRYHVTLAYIPWNHWRTRLRDASLFREYSDCFSVCLHGCDHTSGEFSSSDVRQLSERIERSASRMAAHEKRTGIAWEPLMVCPQERFSLAALEACAESEHVIGLVNTRLLAPASPEARVRGAELFMPATDAPYGVAMFKRHYIEDLAQLVMSVFLGRPAILVTHHDFFRKGTETIEQFVHTLGRIQPTLGWRQLSRMATELCARRRVSDSMLEVRIFSDEFRLRQDADGADSYRVVRRAGRPGTVREVLVDGCPVEFVEGLDGFITFEIRRFLGGQAEIRIMRESAPIARQAYGGFVYQLGVALRRGLSELRDEMNALKTARRSAG